jgi:hypothetical protein
MANQHLDPDDFYAWANKDIKEAPETMQQHIAACEHCRGQLDILRGRIIQTEPVDDVYLNPKRLIEDYKKQKSKRNKKS